VLEVRSDLVKRHLRDSDLPHGEVAGLLGFAGPSSFSHWSRSQFGCSASQRSTQAAAAAADHEDDGVS
jgi:AraC-like DNA-binding protein